MTKQTEIAQALVPALLEWFGKNARDLPWRRTCDPYAVWISEIMLQQTQVKTVIPYWERWMRELPSVESLAQSRPDKVLKLWEGLGYYSRARNAQKAAKVIVDELGGVFPRNYEDVLELPGIGRYTAGAICSIAFNQPAAILDGNVARVLSRVYGVTGNVKEKGANAKLWQLAQELVDCASHLPDRRLDGVSDCALQIAENFKFDNPNFKVRTGSLPGFAGNCSGLNQSLMELGALVCLPRQPNCIGCPVCEHCFARNTNRVEEFPMLGERVAMTRRRFAAFVIQEDGRYLVRQRPENGVNGRLWEFPNVEISPKEKDIASAVKPFVVVSPEPICQINHSITRYRILLQVFRAEASAGYQGSWKSLPQLRRLAFTGAHRKIVELL